MKTIPVQKLSLKSSFNSFKFLTFRYDNMNAMIMRNHGQALVGIILRMIPAMGGSPSQSLASITRSVLSDLSQIANHQGIKGLVLYLKTVSVLTQQYLGGYRCKSTTTRVSITKSGIPRMFPPVIRKQLKLGNTFYMKYSLTLASLYRDLLYEGPIKLQSITNPFSGKD
jgi:hypothetical protein